MNYEPPTYDNGEYQYPAWAHGIGWSLAAVSLVCIPVFAVIALIRGEGNTLFKVRHHIGAFMHRSFGQMHLFTLHNSFTENPKCSSTEYL